MKNVILVILIVFNGMLMQAQKFTRASENKCFIYFVRPSFVGSAINFKFFDGEKIIGKFNGKKYMTYECDPGEHLFWWGSDVGAYLNANIQAGKTYIVIANPGDKRKIYSIDHSDKKQIKDVWKIVGKKAPVIFNQEELEELQYENNYFIAKQLERYKEKTTEGKEFQELSQGMEMPSLYLTN